MPAVRDDGDARCHQKQEEEETEDKWRSRGGFGMIFRLSRVATFVDDERFNEVSVRVGGPVRGNFGAKEERDEQR